MPIMNAERRSAAISVAPWYCDHCGERVSRFVRYHPNELQIVEDHIGEKVKVKWC